MHRQEPCRECWARYLCGGGCHHEVIHRGRPACDYIRGWLHYCIGAYGRLLGGQARLLHRSVGGGRVAMPAAEQDADVCVIGGGPAGAALACRFAMLGHSAIVVERHPFPRPRGRVDQPGVWPLAEVLGARTAIEAARFRARSGHACDGAPRRRGARRRPSPG